jgi:cell division topological specificity factor
MSLFDFFRRGSAPIARERLQILLAHERIACSRPDLLGVLREEILAVIGRHVSFEPDKVQIKMDRGKSVSILAVDIEIPNGRRASGVTPCYSRPTFDPRTRWQRVRNGPMEMV